MLKSNIASKNFFEDSSSFDESSSSSAEDSFTFEIGSPFPTMWYNVPDGLERNPDIIRAEIAVTTTPISQAYAEEAYYAVKNVQDVCAADYKSLCSTPSMDLAAVSTFLDNFMTPRALTEVQPAGKGVKLLNTVRSYYRNLGNTNMQGVGKKIVIPRNIAITPKSNVVLPSNIAKSGAHLRKAPLRSVTRNARSLEGPRGPPPRGPPPPNGPPEEGRPPRGPPPPPGSGPNGDFEAADPRGPPPKPEGEEWDEDSVPPPAPWEDVYFNGALGFGAQGDMCMYENFNQLSQPCVDGMAQLYDIRQRFWHDSQEPHGHGFFVVVLAGLALWLLVKRCMMRKHIKKVRTFLNTINENPALKATIEAETGGLQVPDLPCGRRKCSENGEKQCFLKKFCKCLITCVFVFIVSFFMAITSLEITSNIVSNWDADAAANGDENGTSPAAVLLVLLTVTLTEITIFALAVKLGKYICMSVCGQQCDASAPPAPSAPPASPRNVVVMTPMNVPVTSDSGLVQPSTARRMWNRAGYNFSRMFTTGRVHGDYTALNAGEDETEMVTVVPSNAVPQVYVMTAAPVTKVNMV